MLHVLDVTLVSGLDGDDDGPVASLSVSLVLFEPTGLLATLSVSIVILSCEPGVCHAERHEVLLQG